MSKKRSSKRFLSGKDEGFVAVVYLNKHNEVFS